MSDRIKVIGESDPSNYDAICRSWRTVVQVQVFMLRQRPSVAEAGDARLDQVDETGVVISVNDTDGGYTSYCFSDISTELVVAVFDSDGDLIEDHTVGNDPNGCNALIKLHTALFDLNDVAYREMGGQPPLPL